jgi:hypothetical protein
MPHQAYKNTAVRGAANGTIISIVALAVLAGGSLYAYKAGYLGLGDGAQAETELKSDIDSLKGEGLKSFIMKYAKQSSFNQYLSAEDVAKSNAELESFFADATVGFDYATIVTSTQGEKVVADLTDVKLTFVKEPISGYALTPKTKVSRLIDNKNHYYFESPGITDIYEGRGDAVKKLGSISSATSNSEIILNNAGEVEYSKSQATDVKIIEANGGTTLVTIGELFAEAKGTIDGEKLDVFARTNYKNIVLGDMIKIFVGNLEPISIGMDYAYKGDNFIGKISKVLEAKKNILEQKSEAVATAESAQYTGQAGSVIPDNATPVEAEKISFNGDLKVNDISFLIGQAGVVANASLAFSEANAQAIPSGEVVLKINKFPDLIALVTKFMPIPQESIDNGVALLREIGKQENDNFTFTIKLDGTENVLIDGKTLSEVGVIFNKYQAQNAAAIGATSPDATSPDEAVSE